MKVKAVIFDMDGVITNTMPDHFRAWQKVLAEEGINATHEDIYSREGQKGLQSVREIFAEHGKPFHLKEARAILKKKEELFKKIVKIRFVRGARTLLRKLKRKNIELALVTGTSRHELHKILPHSIYRLFRISVTGSDVRCGKPHPEPYLKALKTLGVTARQTIVIENAPFGIRSAKGAGIRCLALETSLSRRYLKGADAVFSSVKELENQIHFSSHV